MFIRLKIPPGLGKSFWVALFIIVGVELAMHNEAIVHRYRSVFAVGRAIDKLHYIEKHPPQLLFIGNSRVDNGIDPLIINHALKQPSSYSFNLGLPGANLLIFHGIVERLNAQNLLGAQGINTVVLGLDENTFQEDNSLGYVGFLAHRPTQWDLGRYQDWLGSYLRLWSYSANLRQLREPDKLLQLIKASTDSIDPIGGAAATYHGYRAGFGATQNEAQVINQENIAQQPPSPTVEVFLWQTIKLLQSLDVRIVVTTLPLRDRCSAFYDPSLTATPYRTLLTRLRQRGIIVLPTTTNYSPSEFINAGHLNNQGAQHFSAELGHQLTTLGIQ
jgi:hypothetical protein